MNKINLDDRTDIPENKILIEELKRINAPPYVTIDHTVRILNLIRSGQIHPTHKGCDSTLEGLAGINCATSLNYHIDRGDDEPSIYASLYQNIFGKQV